MATLSELIERMHQHYKNNPDLWTYRLGWQKNKPAFYCTFYCTYNKAAMTEGLCTGQQVVDLSFVLHDFNIGVEDCVCSFATLKNVSLDNEGDRHLLCLMAIDMLKRDQNPCFEHLTSKLEKDLDLIGA